MKACDLGTAACPVRASGLALPAGMPVGRDGTLWVAENEEIPFGAARVRALP